MFTRRAAFGKILIIFEAEGRTSADVQILHSNSSKEQKKKKEKVMTTANVQSFSTQIQVRSKKKDHHVRKCPFLH